MAPLTAITLIAVGLSRLSGDPPGAPPQGAG
jgi:hypothetical protein